MSAPAARLARLRENMARAELEGVLVSQPESRRYLSGYSATDLPPRDSAGYLLITDDRQFLLTDQRTEGQAASESPDYVLGLYGGAVRMREKLRELVVAARVGRIGFEAHHLPYGLWQEVSETLEGAACLIPASDLVDGLRALKDPDEIDALRAAVALGDAAFTHLARTLRAGSTEAQLAWEVERFFRTHGAEDVAFEPITVAGPNTAIPHARPGARPIGADELVLFDIGARVRGYCSDMTRTVCINSLPPPLSEIWQVVLESQEEAESRVRPGMTGLEVDTIAREVIERHGYGEAFVHGLGHGIGLEVHEPPWLTRSRGENVLEPGMVFSIEPGIYLPDLGGVRIEDLVLLTEAGAEVLCAAPKKLRLEEVLSDLDR